MAELDTNTIKLVIHISLHSLSFVFDDHLLPKTAIFLVATFKRINGYLNHC